MADDLFNSVLYGWLLRPRPRSLQVHLWLMSDIAIRLNNRHDILWFNKISQMLDDTQIVSGAYQQFVLGMMRQCSILNTGFGFRWNFGSWWDLVTASSIVARRCCTTFQCALFQKENGTLSHSRRKTSGLYYGYFATVCETNGCVETKRGVSQTSIHRRIVTARA